MSITPLPGYIIDPNNKNGVILDPKANPYLPGVQFKQGTTEFGGGGTDPNPFPNDPIRTQTDPLTSSSGTSRTNEKFLGKQITDSVESLRVSSQSRQDILTQRQAELEARRVREEDSINKQFESLKTSTEGQQKKEVGSTSAALARGGGYLGVSGSATGVLVTLSETHRAEISTLESKRQQSLNEARNAYSDKDFALARERVAEAKSLEEETFSRQQKYFDTIQKANEKVALEEKKIKTETDIYNTIVGGVTDPKAIFASFGGKISIDEIDSFIRKSKPETDKTAVFKYTNEDMAKLMGAGFSKDEITTLQALIEEKGYSEEIRGLLSPKERIIVDAIYLPKKPTEGGVGGALSIAEAKSLGLPLTLIGRNQAQVINDLNSQTPPSWYTEYLSNQSTGLIKAPVSLLDSQKQWITFREKIMKGFTEKKSSSDVGGIGYDDLEG